MKIQILELWRYDLNQNLNLKYNDYKVVVSTVIIIQTILIAKDRLVIGSGESINFKTKNRRLECYPFLIVSFSDITLGKCNLDKN